MGKLEEFLAGCPRKADPDKKNLSWEFFRTFPGIATTRMYAFLTRPKRAIGEFGAGDYKTPFCFFLFFTFILTILQIIASNMQLAVAFTYSQPAPAQPGISDILTMFFSLSASSLQFITWPFERTIYAFLFLGISVGILALGLWFITGVISLNPAFTIGAYCLPVTMLLSTIWAFVQVPIMLPAVISMGFGLAFALTGIIFMVIIAGYGINALTKTPLITAIMIALFWAVIGTLAIAGAQEFVIYPLGSGLRQMILPAFFPSSFPTAAV